ncbi:hypothetical protein H5410_003150 [Solanum commersonii]|uniref:Uncharacterized protein n=1 Tax=Solanum commersonii TaxID=4109 RepID=A0A9J6B401_SOLCO|nr:hypothetical protein H5410_003150 [Solanum commersonii]
MDSRTSLLTSYGGKVHSGSKRLHYKSYQKCGVIQVSGKDKITWNYPWFPWVEVIHMSSVRPFLLLMGIRGVQPYVLLRVLHQLSRCQVLPITEDMKDFVSKVGSKVPLPE